MVLDQDFVCAWYYIRQMLRKQSQSLKISKWPKSCFACTDLVQNPCVIVPGFFSSLHITSFECTCLVAVYLVTTPNTLQLKTGDCRSLGVFLWVTDTHDSMFHSVPQQHDAFPLFFQGMMLKHREFPPLFGCMTFVMPVVCWST